MTGIGQVGGLVRPGGGWRCNSSSNANFNAISIRLELVVLLESPEVGGLLRPRGARTEVIPRIPVTLISHADPCFVPPI